MYAMNSYKNTVMILDSAVHYLTIIHIIKVTKEKHVSKYQVHPLATNFLNADLHNR